MRPCTLWVLALAMLLVACMPKAYNQNLDPARARPARTDTTDTTTTRKDTLP